MGEPDVLVNCPKCGNVVNTPVKTWLVPLKGPLKQGEVRQLLGLFECPNCKVRFRSGLKTEPEFQETANIKSMVERIKDIKGELMQTLMNLREKIMTLETERASLMAEIGKLRKVAESRVEALESEVGTLRDEVRSLRELLGYQEEEKT